MTEYNQSNAMQKELSMFLGDGKGGDNDDKRHDDSGDEKYEVDEHDHEDCDSNHGGDDDCCGADGGDFMIPDNMDTAKPQIYRTGGGNTGVKGVLADYAEHTQKKRADYFAQQEHNRQMLEKMCFTVKDDKNIQKQQQEDEDEEEDEDLKRIRQQRLNEMKKKQQQQPTGPSFLRPKVFGFLKQISKKEYVEEIDNEPPHVFVIIHLFQNYIPECVKLNQLLSQMAVKYNHIKFLKILSTEAKADYHDEALPSLLVYIGGNLLVSFIPVTEELQGNYVKEDLEMLLSSYDIIPDPTIGKNWEQSLSNNKASRHLENNYSDDDGGYSDNEDSDDEF